MKRELTRKTRVVICGAVMAFTALSLVYVRYADVLAVTIADNKKRPATQKRMKLLGNAIWVGQGDSSRGLTDINKAHTVRLSDSDLSIRIDRAVNIDSRDTEGITESRQVVTSNPNQWVHIASEGQSFRTYVNMDRVFNVAFMNTGSGDVASITLDTGGQLPTVTDAAAVTQLKRIVGVTR
jgi:hypothetical protein